MQCETLLLAAVVVCLFCLMKGRVQVEVLEAREIPRMDTMGTSDPFVKIFTDPKRVVKTSTKKNTLNPVWDNEIFYLMVQVSLA
jgi:Ca2+-dependent lipid-binding protein